LLIDCLTHQDSELFVVEGTHAANAITRVRHKQHQAVLRLQGKLPNAKKKSLRSLLQNKQVASLISSLGGSSFDDLNNPFSRIILLCDADHDGAHARALLILLFYQHMRELISAGRLYSGFAPLYLIKAPDIDAVPAYSEEHRDSVVQKLSADHEIDRAELTIDRFKGLASMPAEDLHQYCVSEESRTIKQLSESDCASVSRALS